MRWVKHIALWAAATLPALTSAQPALPVMTPIATAGPDTNTNERGLEAAALWASGDAKKVSKAYETLGVRPDAKIWTDDGRRVMADWIWSLSWSDLALASKTLADWQAADPKPSGISWTAQRSLLAAQIFIRQGEVEKAKAVTNAMDAAIDAENYALGARIATRPKKRPSTADLSDTRQVKMAYKYNQRAQFLAAVAKKGEAAFADFADVTANPFVDGYGSLFVQMGEPIACAQADLTEADWSIFDVSLVQGAAGKANKVLVRPFAASRFGAFKPFLEQSNKWGITVKDGIGDQARKAFFVRCLRTTRPASEKRPDLDYLNTYLKPMSKELPADYRFDKFRQPVTDLARDGAWPWITNMALTPDPMMPYVQRNAQTELLKMLRGQAAPDPVAIAIAEHFAIPDAEAGRVGQLKYKLPTRIAFIDRVKAEGKLPPRILSEFELQLAKRHESNGEVLPATALYKVIVARDHKAGVPRVAEQIKASLRLAALASAAGRKAESEAIFAELGLSPDQCSIYQSKPAMLSFKHPDYSGAMLRAESEGRVQFKFDLDQAGAPSNLRVTQSSPPFLFDRKTLDSFAAAKFAPVTNGTDALACKGAEQAFMWKIPGY